MLGQGQQPFELNLQAHDDAIFSSQYGLHPAIAAPDLPWIIAAQEKPQIRTPGIDIVRKSLSRNLATGTRSLRSRQSEHGYTRCGTVPDHSRRRDTVSRSRVTRCSESATFVIADSFPELKYEPVARIERVVERIGTQEKFAYQVRVRPASKRGVADDFQPVLHS